MSKAAAAPGTGRKLSVPSGASWNFEGGALGPEERVGGVNAKH